MLEEVEQLVLLISCRIRDIQISHWLGLLNAHWKVYPRGRDWLVYHTGAIWVVMALMITVVTFVTIGMSVYASMLITATLKMVLMITF